MKVYLVRRTDDIDYDEYDGYVVVAENPKKAKELCKWGTFVEPKDIEVKEVKVGLKPRVILGSFNAG